jgi:hypothetical protein
MSRFRRPQQFHSRRHRVIKKCLLHFRMIEIETTKTRRRCRDQVAVVIRCAPPARLDCTAVEQRPVNAEFPGLRNAPGQHPLAANAVAKFNLPLDDEHARPLRGHCRSDARPCKTAADDHQVVIQWPSFGFPGRDRCRTELQADLRNEKTATVETRPGA